MPKIDKYLGIIYIINSGKEHPPPHVHIKYNEFEASMDLKTGLLLNGSLPPRVLKLSRKWLKQNGSAALREWERMERGETPRPLSRQYAGKD